jgi:hypothetical protein
VGTLVAIEHAPCAGCAAVGSSHQTCYSLIINDEKPHRNSNSAIERDCYNGFGVPKGSSRFSPASYATRIVAPANGSAKDENNPLPLLPRQCDSVGFSVIYCRDLLFSKGIAAFQ